jgi:hypothetical protein
MVLLLEGKPMRIGRKSRNLTEPERRLALSVFNKTLPPWKRIFISDGLGLADAPWTDDPMYMFVINMGPQGYPDATAAHALITEGGNFGRIRDVFIHEMTHVWQYWHGDFVKSSAVWARFVEKITGDDAYKYTPGKAWDAYNAEEQASIVEDWFKQGMSTTDNLFPYIKDTIWKK